MLQWLYTVLVNAVQQNESYVYVYIPTCIHISPVFLFSSQLGHHRALSKFPVLSSMFSLIIYFIHSTNNVYMSILISQLSHHPSFPLGVHMFILYIFISVLQVQSSIPFFIVISQMASTGGCVGFIMIDQWRRAQESGPTGLNLLCKGLIANIISALVSALASLVAQTVRHLPTTQETPVRSLGQEDPLEQEMETHSSTLAWKIPWMEDPGGLHSMGSQRVGYD